MKTLIVGGGEVGNALRMVVSKYHKTWIRDISPFKLDKVDILHICFPDSEGFVDCVKEYKSEYRPKLTIINSSVAVGTTDRCGNNVVYSPVRGRHRPRLDAELTSFPKFIAGRNEEDVNLADDYFRACDWQTYTTNDVKGLEVCKLVSNIHMGLEIAWAQEMTRIFKKFGGERKTYDLWENTYNDGYMDLAQYHLLRPIMQDNPIGGHCILECTQILKDQHSSLAFDFIQRSNADAVKEKGN
jgi:UDP-N-acetyl-D-mannosaminuronate dehydrogenase